MKGFKKDLGKECVVNQWLVAHQVITEIHPVELSAKSAHVPYNPPQISKLLLFFFVVVFYLEVLMVIIIIKEVVETISTLGNTTKIRGKEAFRNGVEHL